MNFINRLQNENAELNARIVATEEALTAIRVYLSCDKFRGVESDGSRKDWIATGDVFRLLDEVRDALTQG